jgi:hypothetical protein
VRVAHGATYRSAAIDLRERSGRGLNFETGVTAQGRSNPIPARHAQLVSDMVDTFTPMLWGHLGTLVWPDTVVFDSFQAKFETRATKDMPRTSQTAFHVLAATGANGKALHAQAFAVDNADNWDLFLSSIPGTPSCVVADGAQSIAAAVRRRAQRGTSAKPELWRCECHLGQNLFTALPEPLRVFIEDHPEHELSRAQRSALQSTVNWSKFNELLGMYAAQDMPLWERFKKLNGALISQQVAKRATHKGPFSNGSVEHLLGHISAAVTHRSPTFTNKHRLDQLLLLLVLAYNGKADERTRTELLREKVTAQHGRPQLQRQQVEAENAPTLHRFRI